MRLTILHLADICGFLRWYCHENKVEHDIINKIVSLLDSVRLKYAKRSKKDVSMLKDTFRSDVQKELAAKHRV